MSDLSLDAIKLRIAHYGGLRYQTLAFPPELEARFEADTAARRCARLWLEGLIVIGLFNLFLVTDYFTAPDGFSRAAIIRLGIVTPLALLVNVAMLFKPRKIIRESSIGMVACLAGLSQLVVAAGHDPVASAYAQFGIVAVILFSNCVMRLRFTYAATATVIMLVGYMIFLSLDTQLTPSQKLLGLCLTLLASAGTTVSNYSQNREERLNYLFCLQGELMVGQMERTNEELKILAERDRLTGLLNRHAFDRTLTAEWTKAGVEDKELSVILVDIDHFKHINDRFGHLYGDRVLNRIGHLLREALRRKDDIAARFGGEEFVLLLPDTPGHLARQVAERIRVLVETAGLPANGLVTQIDGQLATISCGVASCIPGPREEPHHLLNAADEALYRAKAAGRNQVHAA